MNYKELIIGLLERIDSEKFSGRIGNENLPGLVDSEKFLKRIYISLREYVRESGGLGMSAAYQYKEKIICMLENISDEKFLNQIQIILKRHIERKDKKHE